MYVFFIVIVFFLYILSNFYYIMYYRAEGEVGCSKRGTATLTHPSHVKRGLACSGGASQFRAGF